VSWSACANDSEFTGLAQIWDNFKPLAVRILAAKRSGQLAQLGPAPWANAHVSLGVNPYGAEEHTPHGMCASMPARPDADVMIAAS
jgi:hypothetical protein